MKVLHFKTLDSTNNYVKKHLKELPEAALVLADYQSSGRGRRGRTWTSDQGKNFLGTYLYKEHLDDGFNALLQSSLAIIDTLESFGVDSFIKLPNDILVNDQKIAGILIEQIRDGSPALLIGIGLNVNDAPNIEGTTSLKRLLGKSIGVAEVRELLSERIERNRSVSFAELFSRFKDTLSSKHLHGIYQNKPVRIEDIDEHFQCRIDSKWVPCQAIQFRSLTTNCKYFK